MRYNFSARFLIMLVCTILLVVIVRAGGRPSDARADDLSHNAVPILSPKLDPQEDPTPSPDPVSDVVTQAGTTVFTVKWKTPLSSKGWIRYGESPDQLKVAYDVRGPNVEDTTHQVSVTNVKRGTSYVFFIIVDGKQYDNHGFPWKVITWTAIWLPLVIRG